jgi:hypothetical protein
MQLFLVFKSNLTSHNTDWQFQKVRKGCYCRVSKLGKISKQNIEVVDSG